MAGIFDKMRDMMFGSYEDEDEYEDEDFRDEDYDEAEEEAPRSGRKWEMPRLREPKKEAPAVASSYESLRNRAESQDFSYTPRTSVRRSQAQVVSIHANVQMNVVVLKPESFEDAQEICDQIKSNNPVVVNLEQAEYPTAQRIMDFLSGTCYSLNGSLQRVANNIFIIAPENVSISGDMKEELKTKGVLLPWASSAE